MGFLNRFLSICCRRVRLLPEGGSPRYRLLARSGLPRYLASAIQHARSGGTVCTTTSMPARSGETATRSSPTPPTGYPATSPPAPKRTRSRLALIYALIDGQTRIYEQHLQPGARALGLRRPLRRLGLDHRPGDPIAEQIHAALLRSPAGLTRTQLRDLCQRNLPAQRLDQALAHLAAAGRATHQPTLTAGRPAELWTAAPAPVLSPRSPSPDFAATPRRTAGPVTEQSEGKGAKRP